MRSGSGQFYPIALLVLFAALSFWLQHVIDLPTSRHDGKTRHDPDSFVENFTVRRFDVDGLLRYRLDSPKMIHYGDDDTSLIERPQLVRTHPGTPDMTLVGEHGFVAAEGETVFFWDNVVATKNSSGSRPPMIAKMPDLTVQPDAGIAFTDSSIEVTQGPSWTRGVGMHLDQNTGVLVIKSQVTGQYLRPKTAR